MAIIELVGVSKVFKTEDGRVNAVEDIGFSVDPGEFVTLVGPSGCGKSTLLNMVAGLFGPTSGRVIYRGRDVDAINRASGYMTQNDHLLPWRDVIGNILVPLEIGNVPRAERLTRARKLIEMMGLGGFERSYPSQISGGMKKRTALARLLAYDPETLLMDEPFAALDAQMRLAHQIELRRLCRTLGKTVLFVTHDLDEAVALGDRCVVFTKRPGRVRQIVDIALPPDRDIAQLRTDSAYQRQCAELWHLLAPEIGLAEADAGAPRPAAAPAAVGGIR